MHYVDDFKFWVNVAGRSHRLPQKEIFRSWVDNLHIFREEMYSRTFETLDDVVREAHEELSTYRDNFRREILDLVKKSEAKRSLAKRKETVLKVRRHVRRSMKLI